MKRIHGQLRQAGLGRTSGKVLEGQRLVFMVPLSEIERLIKDAGFRPARRNTRYEVLEN